ncbi:MAG: hypothetical protein CVV31_08925 [Methanomicrobiales archaeon HGW-Methanomicrobiales-2]|jgi:hypothetical protein|nr:MAG: hypothetical protein CVV31_08925 [Methanomicrobiales archaeon HGW-Methanomicrobiales-2]
MLMSKHHENALIFLGIAVCAGFLLSVPAVAGSGQGLMALESGELLSFSLSNLSVAGNGSEQSGVPTLPDEEVTPDPVPVTPDEEDTPDPVPAIPDEEVALDPVPTPTDAGFPDTGTEPMTSTEPGNNTSPVALAPAVEAVPDGAGSYDDERLAGLIDTASIRLMRLSMEHAHALYLQDADAAAIAADDLHAFSVRLLGEVQPLQVSPGQQPVKDEFIRTVGAYSAASETLLGPMDAGGDAVPAAFRDLAIASEGLETVSRQAGEMQQASARISPLSAATITTAEAPGVSAGTGPVTVTPPAAALPLLERHTYDDQSGENMVSLLAESTRTATVYEAVPANASTARVEAGEGRMFLLVAVKLTNLGHKGDSDLYAIETPGRDAFVLECQGSTFEPMEVPSFTSLGESFDRKTLERYESLKGYLYFDVPATLEVSGATLRADLGDAGAPAWSLGEELGKESDDAGAV